MIDRDMLHALIAPYDRDDLHLDCQGMTNVASYLLSEKRIDHAIKYGAITNKRTLRHMEPHIWIEIDDDCRIDYRCRMWLGTMPYIPHGVVKLDEYPDVKYARYRTQVVTRQIVLRVVFETLTTPW